MDADTADDEMLTNQYARLMVDLEDKRFSLPDENPKLHSPMQGIALLLEQTMKRRSDHPVHEVQLRKLIALLAKNGS